MIIGNKKHKNNWKIDPETNFSELKNSLLCEIEKPQEYTEGEQFPRAAAASRCTAACRRDQIHIFHLHLFLHCHRILLDRSFKWWIQEPSFRS